MLVRELEFPHPFILNLNAISLVDQTYPPFDKLLSGLSFRVEDRVVIKAEPQDRLTKGVVDHPGILRGMINPPSWISIQYINTQSTVTYNSNSRKKYIDFPQKEQTKNIFVDLYYWWKNTPLSNRSGIPIPELTQRGLSPDPGNFLSAELALPLFDFEVGNSITYSADHFLFTFRTIGVFPFMTNHIADIDIVHSAVQSDFPSLFQCGYRGRWQIL
jgi:hypothetical protein